MAALPYRWERWSSKLGPAPKCIEPGCQAAAVAFARCAAHWPVPERLKLKADRTGQGGEAHVSEMHDKADCPMQRKRYPGR